MARDLDGQSAIGHGDAIAVIGDGALSAGMAYEALNKRLIVILNDNKMSIPPPVGAMSNYLSKLYVKPKFQDIKALMAILLRFLPEALRHQAKQVKGLVKGLTVGGTLFEQLGFSYVGPIMAIIWINYCRCCAPSKRAPQDPLSSPEGQRLWSS